MKKRALRSVLFSILFVLPALFGLERGGFAEVADRIVAIVNDDCITLSELNEALKPYLKSFREDQYPPDRAREMRFKMREQVLNKLVDQKLADQEAKKLNIWVEEKEVDEHIERTKSQYSMTEEDLRKALAAEGFTFEQYRKQTKEQILRMKLINIEVRSKVAVTEDEIKNYYEEHKRDYGTDKKYHLRTILIKQPSSGGEDERKAAREKAESIENSLKAGGPGAFEELARRFSEDATAATGGDLGLFSLDELSEEIRETIRGMKAGEITPILERAHGYQILMVEEIKEGEGKTLDDVRFDIQEKLYREVVEKKYDAWLKELRERSFVRLMQ